MKRVNTLKLIKSIVKKISTQDLTVLTRYVILHIEQVKHIKQVLQTVQTVQTSTKHTVITKIRLKEECSMLLPRIFSNNLFDDFFNDDFFTKPVTFKTMNTDIKEYDDKYELKLELPGYEKQNIKVNLKDGYLTVEANHSQSKEEKDSGRYIRRERYEGKVKRSFYVGKSVTEEDIFARFSNGVLEINVPKVKAESETKSIDIN